MQRTHLILIAVLGMGLLAGCMDMSVTTEVNAEGDIDQMDIEMEMDSMMFAFMEESAQDEGYDSVEEMLAEDFQEDMGGDEVGSFSVSVTPPDERDDTSDHLISINVEEIPVEEMDEIETEVDNETVRFVDTDIGGDTADDDGDVGDGQDPGEMDDFGEFDEAMEEINMEYVVRMPGEIQEHNADEISDDGTTATWDMTAEEEPDEQLFVESTIDESADDGDSDAVPGFGIVAGAVALLLGIGLLARQTH